MELFLTRQGTSGVLLGGKELLLMAPLKISLQGCTLHKQSPCEAVQLCPQLSTRLVIPG